MQEFEQYIKEVCDYIEERMKVVARYDDKGDVLYVTFNSSDDSHVGIYGVMSKYCDTWHDVAVGAIAQQIMRMLKETWLSLLMRKDGM